MRITRWSTLAICAVAGAVVTYLAMAISAYTGTRFPSISVSVGVVLVAGAGVLVVLGWPVRQFTRGKRKHIDALRAARILALAKACTIVGALLTGGYAVVLGQALGHLTSALLQQRAWAAGIALLGAIALTVAGMLVQHFCRIPPTSPDEQNHRGHSLGDPPQDAKPA